LASPRSGERFAGFAGARAAATGFEGGERVGLELREPAFDGRSGLRVAMRQKSFVNPE
jgi:hypothetical protein